MPAFNEKPFKQRLVSLGDESERVFEETHPLGKFERFGMQRPDMNVGRANTMMRYRPDYHCQAGYLVEVLGVGRDGIIKGLKVEKWDALKRWQRFAAGCGMQVALFVWNSHEQKYLLLQWSNVAKLVAASRRRGTKRFESDNVEYFPIPWEDATQVADLVGEWVP